MSGRASLVYREGEPFPILIAESRQGSRVASVATLSASYSVPDDASTVILSMPDPRDMPHHWHGSYEHRLAEAKAALYGTTPPDVQRRIEDVREAMRPENQRYDVNYR
jgi:hypothetical protein